MNKYLEKAAELLSEENKQIGKTFGLQTVAGIPAHIVGGAAGGALGAKHLNGAAKAVNNSFGRAAVAARKLGTPGRWVGKKLMGARGVSGATLGVGLGMSAMGGITDLASLKHGMNSKKAKRNE